MKIDVVLFASLAAFQPDGRGGRGARSFELAEGTTIADVIGLIGLPDEPRIVFVNQRHAAEDTVLRDGDRLGIFPPVAGG